MKVIAKVDSGTFICEIGEREIEKYLDLYYNPGQKMEEIKIGDKIDLARGYHFYHKTRSALEKTEEFINANKEIIETILTGITIMANGRKFEPKGPDDK